MSFLWPWFFNVAFWEMPKCFFLKHKHHLQHMGNIMGFHGILCKEWDKNPHIFMGDEDPLWVNPCDLTIDTNMGMAQNLSEIH
jgi:hypothetical protein